MKAVLYGSLLVAGCGGASSSGGGGSSTCSDTNGHNSLSNPDFLDDASSGIGICDKTGLSRSGTLDTKSDTHWYRGYTRMESGCTPTPTAVVSGMTAPLTFCFYLQDDTAPVVNSCPTGTTMMADANDGYTGCCGTAMPPDGLTIALTDIANLDMTSANTGVALSVGASASSCDPYSITVHF
jgi:hypothetical protein